MTPNVRQAQDRLHKLALQSQFDLASALEETVAAFDLRHGAYLALELPQLSLPEPLFVTTYPSRWIEHYRTHDYVSIDPVLHKSVRSIMPCNWRDLASDEPAVRRLFKEAKLFGIGENGVTIPIRGPNGEIAMFSLSTNASSREWHWFLAHYLGHVQLVAHAFHGLVVKQHGIDVKYRLGKREREVLSWLAAGKTQVDVASILGLSQHTVDAYLRSAKHKLNAINTAHVIAKAVRMQLVTPGP